MTGPREPISPLRSQARRACARGSRGRLHVRAWVGECGVELCGVRFCHGCSSVVVRVSRRARRAPLSVYPSADALTRPRRRWPQAFPGLVSSKTTFGRGASARSEGRTLMDMVLGIDVGGTSIKVGLFTPEGELLDERKITTTELVSEQAFAAVTGAITEFIAEHDAGPEDVNRLRPRRSSAPWRTTARSASSPTWSSTPRASSPPSRPPSRRPPSPS